MNPTVVVAFWRQRLASPARMGLGIFFLFMNLIPVTLLGSVEALGKTGMAFAFVLASGLIGQEVSSGVLTLTFARPLRRWEYVFSRWLGAVTLASVFVVVQVVLAAAVAVLRHQPPGPLLLLSKTLEGVLTMAGLSAVLLLFSSLVPGLGDLVLYVACWVTVGVVEAVGQGVHVPGMMRAGEEIGRFLGASIDPSPLFGAPGALSPFEAASYLSTIALCLALAMLAVDRRELSYANE